jgi:glycosyltransferase involved in cell wall biosynthesis
VPTNRIYYGLKPYLPWRLRITLRRIIARWRREAYQDVWPVKESAKHPPIDWPGWPDGKKFALVLTHDVEGSHGLAKCRQLMRLEMEMGFRSSFNFIPEGEYRVSQELRGELQNNGFEVGIQDLKHDGKLFQSRETFRSGAIHINRYLREWGAKGFRSGFMFHNLEWVHDLDVDYASCTFDTDPFEPQPDDVGTIFPFWVSRANGHVVEPANIQSWKFNDSSPSFKSCTSPLDKARMGYVELPYTLPQDSTLFLLLRERQPDIWFNKLDWVAKHGGMVLVNTHPDYMAMDGKAERPDEFPVGFYELLLEYVRSKYAGAYWQALPKEVAKYVSSRHNGCVDSVLGNNRSERREAIAQYELVSANGNGSLVPTSAPCETVVSVPAQISVPLCKDSRHSGPARNGAAKPRLLSHNGKYALQGRHAAVLLFSEYPADPRPRRAAEVLIREGVSVDVICLQGSLEEPKRETIDGVDIFRVPLQRRRGSKIGYIFQYGAFVLASFIFLCRRSLSKRYDLVHVHNMPDVLVFSALVPKLLGAKVMLDLHDPMPELMLTIFKLQPQSRSVRLLKLLEKWSTGFADLVLTVNQASKRIYTSRSCMPEKVQIIMNSPDERVFQFQPVASLKPKKKGSNEPFVVMYHGSIFPRNGLDLAVDALEIAMRSVPNATLVICGDNNPFLEQVMASVKERGLEKAVSYLGRCDYRQIVEAIDKCDIGVIPNRRNTFTEMNTPTRIFEYMARGKAVIAPRAQGIKDYFADEDILYFELGDASDLARKIEYAFFHPDETGEIIRRGQEVYLAHRWSRESAGFINAVTELSGHQP